MTPSDSTHDAAIIVRLTRENERLRLANSALQTDLNLIAIECTDAGVPHNADDCLEAYDVSTRVRLLREQVAAAIANTPKATCWEGYSVYHVVTPTSIDDVEDLVVARSEEAVRKWYVGKSPYRSEKDLKPDLYEVRIERLDLSFWTEVHVLWEGPGKRTANWPLARPSSSASAPIPPATTPPASPAAS